MSVFWQVPGELAKAGKKKKKKEIAASTSPASPAPWQRPRPSRASPTPHGAAAGHSGHSRRRRAERGGIENGTSRRRSASILHLLPPSAASLSKTATHLRFPPRPALGVQCRAGRGLQGRGEQPAPRFGLAGSIREPGGGGFPSAEHPPLPGAPGTAEPRTRSLTAAAPAVPPRAPAALLSASPRTAAPGAELSPGARSRARRCGGSRSVPRCPPASAPPGEGGSRRRKRAGGSGTERTTAPALTAAQTPPLAALNSSFHPHRGAAARAGERSASPRESPEPSGRLAPSGGPPPASSEPASHRVPRPQRGPEPPVRTQRRPRRRRTRGSRLRCPDIQPRAGGGRVKRPGGLTARLLG